MSEPASALHMERSGSVLAVRGDISFDEEKAFEEALIGLFEAAPPPYTVDLSEVNFMNSSCVRVVATTLIRVNHKAELITIRAKQKVLRMFEMAGINQLGAFEFVEDQPEG